MSLHYWGTNTLGFLCRHMPDRPELVRVATGYFSVQGYALLRDALGETHMRILVGFEEGTQEKVLQNLVPEILAEVRSWNTDRYAAVLELVEALAERLRLTHTRVRLRDHAKVFIFGVEVASVGSANLTRSGLLTNHEASSAHEDSEVVAGWIDDFDSRWYDPDTIDVTDELRARLEAWLGLKRPWEIYLKAALLLLGSEAPAKPNARYRQPAEYQQVVVKRTLKQLVDPDRRGALLVASTGLGKTIMATAVAYELAQARAGNHVLAFVPAQLKDEWKRRFNSARVSNEVFTIDLLTRKARGKGAGRLMEEALGCLDESSLLIIDESHNFRNRFKLALDGKNKRKVRLAVSRIESAAANSGCMVLLLTATPYAADLEDINNQLQLLPHTSSEPPRQGMIRFAERYPWAVQDMKELIELPVVTILNTPFVAKHFSEHDPDNASDFVSFPDGTRRYIPRISVYRGRVGLPCEAAMRKVLDRRHLRHVERALPIGDGFRKLDNVIERHASIAWASSPPELSRTLQKVLDGGFDFVLRRPMSELEAVLRPIIAELDAMRPEDDHKLQAVLAIIARARAENQKIVVFAERHETVHYLEFQLRSLYGDRIASVVEQGSAGIKLKDEATAAELISHFAPASNTMDQQAAPDNLYDVLLTTDALAEGVNLQDASYLISYDLAWTADVIIQRAGRIMRLWHDPRKVHLYTFVPHASVPAAEEMNSLLGNRFRRLAERLDESATYTELPLLPEGEESYERLGPLSRITFLETSELDYDIAFDPSLAATTEGLIDYATLQANRQEADGLDDDLRTARVSARVKEPKIVTIIRYRNHLVAITLDDSGSVRMLADDEVFSWLRCDPDEPQAFIDAAEVETMRHQVTQAWRQQQGLGEAEEVEHLCSALLVPEDGIERLMVGLQ